MFHFDNKVFYLGQQRMPGDVAEFSAADADNLTKGGSGHSADVCPGDCLAVKNGNARRAEEVTDAADSAHTHEPENPSGEGPDAPVEAPADPEPRKSRRKKN